MKYFAPPHRPLCPSVGFERRSEGNNKGTSIAVGLSESVHVASRKDSPFVPSGVYPILLSTSLVSEDVFTLKMPAVKSQDRLWEMEEILQIRIARG